MSMDGQGSKCRRKIAENFKRLSRVNERCRQTTDGRATAYSEREFTFAKNHTCKQNKMQYTVINTVYAGTFLFTLLFVIYS